MYYYLNQDSLKNKYSKFQPTVWVLNSVKNAGFSHKKGGATSDGLFLMDMNLEDNGRNIVMRPDFFRKI